jgi:hypothetical protein
MNGGETMISVSEALNAFRAFIEPQDGLGDGNPFKLACSLDGPASAAEVTAAWPSADLPEELLQAWSVSRQSRLFEDVDYGQWGLKLLSPEVAAQRTAKEQSKRPEDYRSDDVVIGEFLGDLELLVYAPSEANRGHVLIALPLDERADWYAAGIDLAEFLVRFRTAFGDKFWE